MINKNSRNGGIQDEFTLVAPPAVPPIEPQYNLAARPAARIPRRKRFPEWAIAAIIMGVLACVLLIGGGVFAVIAVAGFGQKGSVGTSGGVSLPAIAAFDRPSRSAPIDDMTAFVKRKFDVESVVPNSGGTPMRGGVGVLVGFKGRAEFLQSKFKSEDFAERMGAKLSQNTIMSLYVIRYENDTAPEIAIDPQLRRLGQEWAWGNYLFVAGDRKYIDEFKSAIE